MDGPPPGPLVEHWRRNQANLRLVLESTSEDPAEAPSALILVMALEGYWLVTGRFAEARHWLDRALATATDHGTGGQEEVGAALSMGAYVGGIQGDDAYAARQLARAEEVLRGCEDGLVLGYHAFAVGSMHLFQGDMDSALIDVRRASTCSGPSATSTTCRRRCCSSRCVTRTGARPRPRSAPRSVPGHDRSGR